MPILTDGDPASFSTEPPMAGDTGTDAGAVTTQRQASTIYVKKKGHHQAT